MRHTIYKFQDYRSWIQAEVNARKKLNPSYSINAFAKKTGVSQSLLSLILKGQRHLGQKSALAIAQAIKLSANEIHYLDLMLQLAKVKEPERKAHLKQELQKLARDVKQDIRPQLGDRLTLPTEDLPYERATHIQPEDLVGRWEFAESLSEHSPKKVDWFEFKLNKAKKTLSYALSSSSEAIVLNLRDDFQTFFVMDTPPITQGAITFMGGRFVTTSIWLPTKDYMEAIAVGVHVFELLKGKKEILWRTVGVSYQKPDSESLAIYPEFTQDDFSLVPWSTAIRHKKI